MDKTLKGLTKEIKEIISIFTIYTANNVRFISKERFRGITLVSREMRYVRDNVKDLYISGDIEEYMKECRKIINYVKKNPEEYFSDNNVEQWNCVDEEKKCK